MLYCKKRQTLGCIISPAQDWIVDLVEGPLKDLIQSLLDQFPIDFGRFI